MRRYLKHFFIKLKIEAIYYFSIYIFRAPGPWTKFFERFLSLNKQYIVSKVELKKVI